MILSYQFLFNLLILVYAFSTVGYFVFFITQKDKLGFFAFVLALAGCVLHAGLIVYRSLAIKSLAVANLYESLNFFALVLIVVYLIRSAALKPRPLGRGKNAPLSVSILSPSTPLGMVQKVVSLSNHKPRSLARGVEGLISERKQRQWCDGVFVLPLVLSLTVYAGFLNSAIVPLPPALKSPWMAAHVSFCFISYACFTLALIFAVMFLWQEKELKSRKIDGFFFRLPSLEFLDRLGYRVVVFGFIFLSLGIVSGSVWAQQAWGSFWSWDPKETWSLALWMLYLVYLHSRLMFGWRGKRSAYLAIIGFGIMLFTYLGVSFFLPGQHSYLS